jgi:hypothetical protein
MPPDPRAARPLHEEVRVASPASDRLLLLAVLALVTVAGACKRAAVGADAAATGDAGIGATGGGTGTGGGGTGGASSGAAGTVGTGGSAGTAGAIGTAGAGGSGGTGGSAGGSAGAAGSGGTGVDADAGPAPTDARPDSADAGFSCPGVAGRKFGSLVPMECGLAPGGIVYCTWTIDFNAQGGYYWFHSDTPSFGSYRCEGAQIIDTTFNPTRVAGQYDPQSDRVTWFGAAYAPTTP